VRRDSDHAFQLVPAVDQCGTYFGVESLDGSFDGRLDRRVLVQ
jgi:hypothetical protein